MHLTAPSRRSRSIGTGGRDPSEQVVMIVGMRIGHRGSRLACRVSSSLTLSGPTEADAHRGAGRARGGGRCLSGARRGDDRRIPVPRKREPSVTIPGKQWRARVSSLRTMHSANSWVEPKETKYENRKYAFDHAISGDLGRPVDIRRLGTTAPGLGSGRCTMSGSGRESISYRRRIRRYEECSRTWVQGLPRGPWLPSLSIAVQPGGELAGLLRRQAKSVGCAVSLARPALPAV
jgi:hypothetical protein